MTALASAHQVTLTINDCTGPYGMVHMSGTVFVNYEPIDSGIQAQITANDLKLNNATLTLASTAKLTLDGTDRILIVTTDSTGTGPRGNSITRSGSYELAWDFTTDCVSLGGDWTTYINNRNWVTAVTGYERCGAGCPKDGGRITYSGGIRNVTVTVDFDGSDQAAWASSRGSSGAVLLGCAD
jgi:hypothetical protein